MPKFINGICRQSNGKHIILINSSLPENIQVEALVHEFYHVLNNDFESRESVETVESLAHESTKHWKSKQRKYSKCIRRKLIRAIIHGNDEELSAMWSLLETARTLGGIVTKEKKSRQEDILHTHTHTHTD